MEIVERERDMVEINGENPKNGFKYMSSSIPHRFWVEGKF